MTHMTDQKTSRDISWRNNRHDLPEYYLRKANRDYKDGWLATIVSAMITMAIMMFLAWAVTYDTAPPIEQHIKLHDANRDAYKMFGFEGGK